jgi:hypothetical protein
MIRTIFLLFGMISATGFAQITFEKTYSGLNRATRSWGSCVATTHDQGYVICAPVTINNQNHFLMIKTNPFGDTIKTTLFDGFADCED